MYLNKFKLFGHSQSIAKVTDGRFVGITIQRLLAGQMQIFERLIGPVAAGIVVGQQVNNLAFVLSIAAFQRRADGPVQFAPLRVEHGFVGHFLGDDMLEQKVEVTFFDFLAGEIFGLQAIQMIGQVRISRNPRVDSLQQIALKGSANRRRNFKGNFFGFGQPVNPGQNHLLNRIGQFQLVQVAGYVAFAFFNLESTQTEQ